MNSKLKILGLTGSIIAVLCISFIKRAANPEAAISNGLITAQLYLPDSEKGYYQATRFDWSGIISSLEYKNHSFFGKWFDKYDPMLNDAIMGPVQEFGPLGYDQAEVGESFVKIGVGSLKKIQEKSYRYAYTYEISNPGKWTVKTNKDKVIFVHELKDESGYSYLYTKIVQLIEGKPHLVLQHSLKNTGSKIIETNVYDHNFFVIDKEPTGSNIEISFPFQVIAKDRGIGSLKGFGTIANIKGRSIIYNRALNKGEQVYSSGLEGYRKVTEDYNITVENVKSGAGVKITSDQVLDKLVYWSNPSTYCPEPYIKLVAAPGKEVKWKYNYEFYTFEPRER